MHKFVSLNHQIISSQKASLPAISSASFYGKGVFTTLAVYNSKPFLWEKHWRRLNANAQKIGVDLAEFDEEAVKKSLSRLITQNESPNARARITFFDELSGGVWSFERGGKTSLLISTADFQETKSRFALKVSPFRVNSTSPLAGIKSCNYLENLMALEDAKQNGFDEAIRLNERDAIVSASMANIFWVKNGEIFTPSLETGCLAGTTRASLLENFPVRETQAGLNELAQSDEVFLTSTGIGIVKVKSVENRVFSATFEKTEQLQSFLIKIIKKSS